MPFPVSPRQAVSYPLYLGGRDGYRLAEIMLVLQLKTFDTSPPSGLPTPTLVPFSSLLSKDERKDVLSVGRAMDALFDPARTPSEHDIRHGPIQGP